MSSTDLVHQFFQTVYGLCLFGVWFLGFRWYWRKRTGVVGRLTWAGRFAKAVYFLSFIPLAWLLTLFYAVTGAIITPLLLAVLAVLAR